MDFENAALIHGAFNVRDRASVETIHRRFDTPRMCRFDLARSL
jgi:hypothetical protein